MIKTTLLALFFFETAVFSACLYAETLHFPIDPTSGFFFAGPGDNEEDPLIIDLQESGVVPGQFISLRTVGAYAWWHGSEDDIDRLVAVFSKSKDLLPSNQVNRVVEAINAGEDTYQGESCSQEAGNKVQDIEEDFEVRNFELKIAVPDEARFLFVGTRGCWFRDQVDKNGDLQLSLTVPEPTPSTVPESRLEKLRRGTNVAHVLVFPDDKDEYTFSADDFIQFKRDGLTNIRLFLYADNFIKPFASEERVEEALGIVDTIIEKAISVNFAISLVVASGPESVTHDLIGTNEGWTHYLEFWSDAAKRYAKHDPEFLFFESVNEPQNITGNAGEDCHLYFFCAPPIWRIHQQEWIDTIRKYAPEHTLLVTAAGSSNYEALTQFDPYGDTNLIYLFHYYYPHVFTFPFAESDTVELLYPACMPGNQGLTETVNDPNHANLIEDYLGQNWNYERILSDFKQIAAWRDTHEVSVINNEFAAWALSRGMDGNPDISNRLRWIRDTRIASEKSSILWNVYSVNSYYIHHGESNNEPEKWVPEEYKLEALGARPWSYDEPECLNVLTKNSDVRVTTKKINNPNFTQPDTHIRFTVTNDGPDVAHNNSFRLWFDNETNIKFASAGSGDCNVSGQIVICDIKDINNGSSVPVVVAFSGSGDSNNSQIRVIAHEKDPQPENNFLEKSWSTSQTQQVNVNKKMSGSFYDPNHNGEGWLLEILKQESFDNAGNSIPGRAVAYWFTYSPTDPNHQTWIVGEGEIMGDTIFFKDAISTSGGIFGPEFSPDDIKVKEWGDFWMVFGSTDMAQVGWNSRQDGYGSSELNSTRLTLPLGVNSPSTDVSLPTAYSGSWYDPAHNGEGWLLEILENNRVVIYWFTYNDKGVQAWLTGVGTIENNKITSEMLITNGTTFGSGFSPNSVMVNSWGKIEIEFVSCNEAILKYESDKEEYGSGSLHPIRLTTPLGLECP